MSFPDVFLKGCGVLGLLISAATLLEGLMR